jgi:hypothetical protein
MARTPTKRELHAHGCRQCRTRYQDTCKDRGEDDLCPACLGGKPSELLIHGRAPRTCCLASRLVTKAERTLYDLAGRSNWHICPTCARTHPFKPTEKEIRT